MTCIAIGIFMRASALMQSIFCCHGVDFAGRLYRRSSLCQDCVISFAAAMAVAILNWYFVARVAKTNPVAASRRGLAQLCLSERFSIIVHGLPIMLPTLAVFAVLLAGPAIIAAILSMRSGEIPSPVAAAIPPGEPTEITSISV